MRALVRNWIQQFIDLRRLASTLFAPRYFAELFAYRRRAVGESVKFRDSYPCLSDRLSHTPFDPHYFYQGAWLARRLAATNSTYHVDVGSSVLMVSVLSARIPVIFVDYRPLRAGLSGIVPVAGNVACLPFADGSLESVSSLHVIEHIGLGRYGDPLDPQGSMRAACELQRVIRPGGRLFVSVPVGRERVCFNAHRVFAPRTIIEYFSQLHMDAFSFVDDSGGYIEAANPADAEMLDYGCGLFEFQRPHA